MSSASTFGHGGPSQDTGDAGYESLAKLALDVRRLRHDGTEELWRQIDPELWDATQNPWLVLQTASRERLNELLAAPAFQERVAARLRAQEEAASAPAWFQQAHGDSALTGAVYLSMEYMLDETLPIYSGGLGNVAGDQLKAASDLGVPVTAIGLLYQQGYFRQEITADGDQRALYPYNDPGQMPMTPLRSADGEWVRLAIDLRGSRVWLRTWQVTVGRVRLLLLDSNDAANCPAHRRITGELYGGGVETRLQQEIVLGIGGWRLLETLGLAPEVCHLNEGHAAFAVLERARCFMQRTGSDFHTALTATRAGNLFTTHTAVAAGFDAFPPDLMERYLGGYAADLGISLAELMALGRWDPNNPSEHFFMAYLAMRGSGAVNGVSRLHGEVSRDLFAPLFPRWPLAEVPIGHVTNGIHVPTWGSAAAEALWTEACGSERWEGSPGAVADNLGQIPDARLWELRNAGRQALVARVRARLAQDREVCGGAAEAREELHSLLRPDVLTIGFARRFAPYKRPSLLLRDPERLVRLLTDPQRPIQLVLAGKAHPADCGGQGQIRQWIQFLARPEVRRCAVFLSDYDMRLASEMIAGADLWLNTPRRPWEACGTSGMKVLANGGLNFSELDGWWSEAFTPEVGWALGDGQDHGDDPMQDIVEAEELYERLEQEIIPEFYQRDSSGVPTAWVTRMRESMARLTPQFSANRAVKEYTEKFYLPAAAAYRKRTADGAAAEIAAWEQEVESRWPGMRFGAMTSVGADVTLEVMLGGIDPQAVRVELYADGVNGPTRVEMQPVESLPEGRVYHASLPAGHSLSEFAARIVPNRPEIAMPLEIHHILWQR